LLQIYYISLSTIDSHGSINLIYHVCS
jgi:hypothetical protein